MKPTEEQIEDLVIDLYFNQKKTYREIAPVVNKSSRDIRKIIERQEKQIEEEQHRSLSSQAYALFLQDKTPPEVAIALKIRQKEVSELYAEFLAFKGMHDFARVYQETKGDTDAVVKLYREIKAWGMDTAQVRSLLEIANNDLPSLRNKRATILAEVQGIENAEQNSLLNLQHSRSTCRELTTEIENFNQEKIKLNALVNDFKDNDQGYIKITKSVEEEVIRLLSGSEELLRTALVLLLRSLREDPDKYDLLIEDLYNRITLPTIVSGAVPVDFVESILVEQTKKLHNILLNELSAKVINNFLSMRLPASPELSCLFLTNKGPRYFRLPDAIAVSLYQSWQYIPALPRVQSKAPFMQSPVKPLKHIFITAFLISGLFWVQPVKKTRNVLPAIEKLSLRVKSSASTTAKLVIV